MIQTAAVACGTQATRHSNNTRTDSKLPPLNQQQEQQGLKMQTSKSFINEFRLSQKMSMCDCCIN